MARPDGGGKQRGRGADKKGRSGHERHTSTKPWDHGSRRKFSRQGEEDEIRTLEERVQAEAPASRASPGGAGATGGTAPPSEAALFSELPVSSRTLQGLEASKFVKMTEIQRGAIPHALCGRDLLGEARTGSGKTLAFLVPVLELLFRRRWTRMDGLGALIISPTRELAYQIFKVVSSVGQDHDFSAGCIVGGRSLEEEQKAVAQMNILVATPGRLLQHLDESAGFDASGLLMLVMDEADRILDFGFQETLHNILGHLPTERQTLLFSATLHSSVHRLGRAALRSPEVVSVHRDAKSQTPDKLKQVCMVVPLDKKVDMLFSFLRSHSQKKMIVFVSACKQVRFLFEAFKRLKPGPSVMEFHGRQSLTKRMVTFEEFTEREKAVALLCTDVAARGVDFPAVDWVIQLDCPDSVESYVHRVGRTARYESSGRSAIFLLPSEEAFAAKLQAARVNVKSISAKQGKVVPIQQKLSALLAGEPAIKHLAQKALVSYVRSIQLMKDKEIFDSRALPLEEFALSLGLAAAPSVPGLGKDEADTESNSLKRQKNRSALQRLKEKIQARKHGAKAAATSAGPEKRPGPTNKANTVDDSEEEEELGQKQKAKRKLGRWERRQRQIEQAKKASTPSELPTAPAETADDGDLLVPIDSGSAAVLQSAPRSKRLKIRKSGQAVGADGKHIFFTGKQAHSDSSAVLRQFADGDGRGVSPKGAGAARARQEFLNRVASGLAERDRSDAAASRARIHERHQKRRRQERAERQGKGDLSDDDVMGGPRATLAASDSDSSPRAFPGKPNAFGAGEQAGDSDADSSPRMYPGVPNAAGKAAAKSRPGSRGGRAGKVDVVEELPPAAVAFDGDDIGSLEREALSKLAGGGLFG